MSYQKIAHIKVHDSGHYVHIGLSVEHKILHLFKYDLQGCDYEYFCNIDTSEQLAPILEWAKLPRIGTKIQQKD